MGRWWVVVVAVVVTVDEDEDEDEEDGGKCLSTREKQKDYIDSPASQPVIQSTHALLWLQNTSIVVATNLHLLVMWEGGEHSSLRTRNRNTSTIAQSLVVHWFPESCTGMSSECPFCVCVSSAKEVQASLQQETTWGGGKGIRTRTPLSLPPPPKTFTLFPEEELHLSCFVEFFQTRICFEQRNAK